MQKKKNKSRCQTFGAFNKKKPEDNNYFVHWIILFTLLSLTVNFPFLYGKPACIVFYFVSL